MEPDRFAERRPSRNIGSSMAAAAAASAASIITGASAPPRQEVIDNRSSTSFVVAALDERTPSTEPGNLAGSTSAMPSTTTSIEKSATGGNPPPCITEALSLRTLSNDLDKGERRTKRQRRSSTKSSSTVLPGAIREGGANEEVSDSPVEALDSTGPLVVGDEADQSHLNRSSNLLVEASLVTGQSNRNIPEAEIVEDKGLSKTFVFAGCVPHSSGAKWLCGWVVFLVAAVAITGITCGAGACSAGNRGNNSNNQDFSDDLLFSGDDGIDDGNFAENWRLLEVYPWEEETEEEGFASGRLGFPDFTIEAFQNSRSAQSQALVWLSGHPSLETFYPGFQRALFALVTLYHSFDGDAWPIEIGITWLSYEEDECFWGLGYKATYPLCSTDDNRHVSLYFQDVPLLDVVMPPEVSFLDSIQTLSLEGTNISSSFSEIIPPELEAWTGLESILLAGNEITGTIPTYLDIFRASLTTIQAQGSYLSGTIPSEIGALVVLEDLTLYDNEITGQLPTELGEMESLLWLDLDYNNLQSTLPTELGMLGRLEGLSLASATLIGTLPTELGLLTMLEHLDLQENPGLSGTIPNEIAQLRNLTHVYLGSTSLEGAFSVEICRNNQDLVLVSISCDLLECLEPCPCSCI